MTIALPLTPHQAHLFSSQNILDDFAFDIGKSEISSTVPICEFGMVKATKVQNCGVKIVGMHWFVNCLQPEIVGGAVRYAALDASAGK